MPVSAAGCSTGGRRRRLATIAVTALAIGVVGSVVVNEVSTAGASTRPVARSLTATTVHKVARRNRKRKGGRARVVKPTSTTSTTKPKSTSSTTSTTVARKTSPSNTGGTGGARSGGFGGAVATQAVSAHHSGISTSTMIVLLLALGPLILLGFGLVFADLAPRSPRARRRDPVGMPQQR
jgi:hypothetical protein